MDAPVRRGAPVEITWRVVPLGAPRVRRHCPRCGVDRVFESTGRFRVNAQGRRLDVWLVFGCTECDRTWNLTLWTRVRPADLGADLLDRVHHNDPATAATLGTDPAVLSAAGVRAEPGPFEVIGPRPDQDPVAIDISAAMPVRLDRVLCAGLGLSRSALLRAVERGAITVDRRDLARPAGGRVLVSPLGCAGARSGRPDGATDRRRTGR